MLDKEIDNRSVVGIAVIIGLIFVLFVLPELKSPTKKEVTLPPGVEWIEVGQNRDHEFFILPCKDYKDCNYLFSGLFDKNEIPKLNLKCDSSCTITYEPAHRLLIEYYQQHKCYSAGSSYICEKLVYLIENSELV